MTRSYLVVVLCAVAGAHLLLETPLQAELANYRGLQFGMNLAAAAKRTGLRTSDARFVQQRPALIQEMDWQPRSMPMADPVRDAVLSFLNGELYRIVVTYDRYKIEGLTTDDVVEGISVNYRTATKPVAEIAYRSIYGQTGIVIARWEDPQYSYDLVRTGDGTSFAMVLYSKGLEAAAQASILEAARLDLQEAPQREMDKQRKLDEGRRLDLEKSRTVNKPNFRP